MTRWPSDESIEQRAGRIECDGVLGVLRCRYRPFAAHLAGGDRIDQAKHVLMAVVLDDRLRGAGQIDGDDNEAASKKALVELPRHAGDIDGAVLAYAPARADRERRR